MTTNIPNMAANECDCGECEVCLPAPKDFGVFKSKEKAIECIKTFLEFSEQFEHELDEYSMYDFIDLTEVFEEPDGGVYEIHCPECNKVIVIKLHDKDLICYPLAINNGSNLDPIDHIHMYCDGDRKFVYCIIAGNNEFIKIGISNDPIKRLKSIKTGNPFKLELYSLFIGGENEERATQAKFSHLLTQAKNEWFKYDKSILDFFDQRCSC